MHATDAAGRKNLYAGAMRNPYRGRDGCGTVPAARDSDRQIACAQLLDVIACRNAFNLVLIQSYAKLPIQNGDRRRRGAFGTNNLLEALRSFEVLRSRQAVRDHG